MMNKAILATKHKDGWHVTLSITSGIKTIDKLLQLAEDHDLKHLTWTYSTRPLTGKTTKEKIKLFVE